MTESVKVGDKFPVSELVASDGQRLDLESLPGPAVVYFYPADGTSTCTLEAVEFNRAIDDYEGEHRKIEFHGALSDEQRARLLQIADRCPVKQTLERGIAVQTIAQEHLS